MFAKVVLASDCKHRRYRRLPFRPHFARSWSPVMTRARRRLIRDTSVEEIRAHRAQGQDHAAAQDELPCPDFGEQPDWKDCPDNPAPASQSAQTATQGATQSAAQSAFLTEPELSWDDTVNSSSWLGMASHLESSLLERNTLIEDLKKVLEVATREQSDWRRQVKAMRRCRAPGEPNHWHDSVNSALTWRAREVEALQKEISHLELKQRAELREICQLQARQSRSTRGSWCSRSTMRGGFSCSRHQSWQSGSSTARSAVRPTRYAPQAGGDLHVILEPTLGRLARRKHPPELRRFGGLCASARHGNLAVHLWGWEPGDHCFRDEAGASASFTLPDVPTLGDREAIIEAQLLHEVMNS
ncbi:unnamed protein product [Effrenium voratum]|nr:unnamed protein product [Effrenium voratum]